MSELSLVKAAEQIDLVAQKAAELFLTAEGFAKELEVGRAMGELRALLTPEVMAPIMALMNNPIGFLTDRNPHTSKNPMQPYGVDVVRDCFIESRLRGFHSVGNEWNIIAGRFYAAQAGFARRVREWPGLTDFEDYFDVPRMIQDKGAIVKCWAKWTINGKASKLEREFAIRVNEYMGADAITGKAKRKLYKDVHDRLLGKVTPDGDIDDTELANAKPANATTTGVQFDSPAQIFSAPWTGPGNPNQQSGVGVPVAAAPSAEASQPIMSTPAPPPKLTDMQDQLQNTLQASGIGFEPFRAWLGALQKPPHDGSQWADMGQVPDSILKAMLEDQPTVKAFVAWKRATAKKK